MLFSRYSARLDRLHRHERERELSEFRISYHVDPSRVSPVVIYSVLGNVLPTVSVARCAARPGHETTLKTASIVTPTPSFCECMGGFHCCGTSIVGPSGHQ